MVSDTSPINQGLALVKSSGAALLVPLWVQLPHSAALNLEMRQLVQRSATPPKHWQSALAGPDKNSAGESCSMLAWLIAGTHVNKKVVAIKKQPDSLLWRKIHETKLNKIFPSSSAIVGRAVLRAV